MDWNTIEIHGKYKESRNFLSSLGIGNRQVVCRLYLQNFLVIATGSSALKIKLNPDLSRRSLLEKLYPLKLNEYVILKNDIFPQRDLSDDLIEAILAS